ncbi:hypothetical protein RGUI_2816 [Rhodovulum sp. P5]|nr:hypothetical protein RGUI_2816 [Rhodovulum sp. P5]
MHLLGTLWLLRSINSKEVKDNFGKRGPIGFCIEKTCI